jgi:hypothetical protein
MAQPRQPKCHPCADSGFRKWIRPLFNPPFGNISLGLVKSRSADVRSIARIYIVPTMPAYKSPAIASRFGVFNTTDMKD